MATQFKASDHCLLSVLLERGNEETEDDRAGIDEMLAAVDALTSGWLVPLGVGLQFAHCDLANYFEEVGSPAHPHQFLRVAKVPFDVRVEQAFSNSEVSTVSVIDAAVIRGAVVQGLEQPFSTSEVPTVSVIRSAVIRGAAVQRLALPAHGGAVTRVSRLEGARG